MLRQSKTTIKELSAQYRNVLKRAFLAGVIAMATSTVTAADTDVTFAGNYTNSDGVTVNVNDAVAGQSYSYEKSDGTTRNVANQATDPTLADFTYTDKDGNAADLSSGEKVQSDFTGTSAASGVVSTTQNIASGETVVRDNYTYTNGAGTFVTLGTAAQDMIDTIALDATYASGSEIVVTNGTAGSSFDGTFYSVTVGNETYHLSADGSKLYSSSNIEVSPEPASELEVAFNNMQTAYTTDTGRVSAAETATSTQWTDEQTNFAAAEAAFNADQSTVSTLDSYWATYEAAATLLSNAQANQSAAKDAYDSNSADLANALSVFNTPITTTITDGANNAIDASIANGAIKNALDTKADASSVADAETNAKAYADGLASNYDVAGAADTAETNAKAYADGLASNYDVAGAADTAETNAKAYADGLASNYDVAGAADSAEANAKTYADGLDAALRGDFATADASTLTEAKTYADAQDALTLTAANQYTDSAIANAGALILKSANEYTDRRVEHLEKDMSAGIANATALSAVAIPNVKKGQLAFSGGYGYYNSQSAVAFGATMGLTDNWSVNLGTGISDKSTSFRAGTTYILDLF